MPGTGYSKRYIYSTVVELANLSGSRIFDKAETRSIRFLYHRVTIENNSPLTTIELGVVRVLRNKYLGHPGSAKWRNRNKIETPDQKYVRELRILLHSSLSDESKERIKAEINDKKLKNIEAAGTKRIK